MLFTLIFILGEKKNVKTFYSNYSVYIGVPNKYICDAFLTIYVSIFVVVVVFPLFDALKDLIRDSQRLQFCKTVKESSVQYKKV